MSKQTVHSTPSSAPSWNEQCGLFFVACAALLLQITWTRILSVTLWYHFAFLIVSTAMLGLGVSGIVLTLSSRLQRIALERGLFFCAIGQSATTLLGFGLTNLLPFDLFTLLTDWRQLLISPFYIACIASPFVFNGIAIALLLSRKSAWSSRLYCFDLIGAASGCFLLIAIMPLTRGTGTVVVCAAIALLGGALFSSSGKTRLITVVVSFVLLVVSFKADDLVPVRISHTKNPYSETSLDALLKSSHNQFSAWNTFSRIDVLPAAWGRQILIDAGTAMTRMPKVTKDPHSMGPILDERIMLFDEKHPVRSALIIGSGGGFEVLACLQMGVQRIVAVEVNPLINDLGSGSMSSFVGNIFKDPAVELHTDEARSFIRRSQEQFDLIIAAHTISNAATASGSLSLTENYLMTVEAFHDLVSHLTPHGKLWITRPLSQLPRLTVTTRVALERLGNTPASTRIIAYAGNEFYGGLIASPSPFSVETIETITKTLKAHRMDPRFLLGPHETKQDPLFETLITSDHATLDALFRDHPAQLDPATDDKPFFNHRTRWSHLSLEHFRAVFSQGEKGGRLTLEDQPIAEAVLVVVFVQAAAMAILFIVLPLVFHRRGNVPFRQNIQPLSYFFLLGLAFIFVEIALIQRLTLFLGQPTYTFAVVVGSLLVSSGIGSLLSGFRRLDSASSTSIARLRTILIALVAILALSTWIYPSLVQMWLAYSLPMRVLLGCVLVAPLGLLMGMPFPLGIQLLGSRHPSFIPWAWGMNAVSSVVGSVAAIILGTMLGFSAVLWIGSLCYGCALLLWTKTPKEFT